MRMVNTFKAHQMIEWAERSGKGHETKLALFSAFFTRRENLNDLAVLSGVAAQVGLDAKSVEKMLDTGELAEPVRQKELFWTSRGISGVPAMIFDRQHLLTGSQGEENYGRVLRHLTEPSAAKA